MRKMVVEMLRYSQAGDATREAEQELPRFGKPPSSSPQPVSALGPIRSAHPGPNLVTRVCVAIVLRSIVFEATSGAFGFFSIELAMRMV